MPNDRHPSPRPQEPPPGNFLPLTWQAMSGRACKPRGYCRVPTRACPHPEPVGSGLQLPAKMAGSQGMASVYPQTPLTKARGAPLPPGKGLLPHPNRAMPGRKRVRCGVGDGPPHSEGLRPKTKGKGPQLHAQKMGSRERGSCKI